MNPVFNHEERRLRAGLRIPIFMILFIILMSIGNSIPLMGFQYMISLILLAGFFWISFRFMDNRERIDEAGLQLDRNWWMEFGLGSLIAFLAMTLIFLTELLSGDLEVSGFAWESISAQFWLIPVAAYLIQHLAVGFYEEFMARSYLITNLKEGFTVLNISPEQATGIAILISSSIFGFLHAGNPNSTTMAVLNIVAAGFMLAVPYVLTGRLALSVGIHFAWNFSQGGIYGFRVSGTEPLHPVIDIQQGGNPIWTGGGFGPEGGLIGLLAIILILISCLYYIRRKEGKLALAQWYRQSFTQNQHTLTNSDELA